MNEVHVLDATCGPKMFWFNDRDPRAVFVDVRREEHELKDRSTKGGVRRITISPDILADFRSMPFPNDRFSLVVFDPPHLKRAGPKSFMAKKYGKLKPDWESTISKGFQECFRVLRPGGTLILKWSEVQIPVSKVVRLSPIAPLFGQRCGKSAKTHWIVFIKPEDEESAFDFRGARGI